MAEAAQQQAEEQGSKEAADKFRREALAVSDEAAIRLNVDPQLAKHNVDLGVAAVLASRTTVQQMPNVNVKRIEELPQLCLALIYVAGLAAREAGGSTGEIASLLATLAHLRHIMLPALQACAAANVIDGRPIAEIEKGSGPRDMTSDAHAMGKVFADNDKALHNRTPVTVDHLRESAAAASRLDVLFKPKGAKNTAGPKTELERFRDGLFTMLVNGYEEARRVGGFLFGKELDEKVPPLHAHKRAKSAPTEATPPA